MERESNAVSVRSQEPPPGAMLSRPVGDESCHTGHQAAKACSLAHVRSTRCALSVIYGAGAKRSPHGAAELNTTSTLSPRARNASRERMSEAAELVVAAAGAK